MFEYQIPQTAKINPSIKVGYALDKANKIKPYFLDFCGLKYQYRKSVKPSSAIDKTQISTNQLSSSVSL
jgi:hypothetical protein